MDIHEFVRATGGVVITTRNAKERLTTISLRWDHTQVTFNIDDFDAHLAGDPVELEKLIERKMLEALIKHMSVKQVPSSSQLLLTRASLS